MEQVGFPFHETAEDATNTAIIRSGKSFQEVAYTLFPSMKPDSAYARLKNALRPDTRELLTADMHIWIGNFVEQYDFLYYCAQQSHHSQPDPIKVEDEAALLMREYIEATKRMEEITKRQERLQKIIPAQTKGIRGAA